MYGLIVKLTSAAGRCAELIALLGGDDSYTISGCLSFIVAEDQANHILGREFGYPEARVSELLHSGGKPSGLSIVWSARTSLLNHGYMRGNT